MIRRLCSLCIMVLLGNSGHATAQQHAADSVKNTRLSAHIMPLTFIDFWSGVSVRAGGEYSLSQQWGIGADANVYLYHQPVYYKDNVKGYAIRPVIKHYIANHNNFNSRRYRGVEYMYKAYSYDWHDSIRLNNTPTFNKNYRISRYVHCISFVYGERKTNDAGFFIEWYIGGGLRLINSTSTLTAEEQKGVLGGEGHGDIIGDAIRGVGIYVAPSITCGMKLGGRLW